PDPDQALNNFEAFVSGMGARGTLYSLLADNPRILEPILTLFSDSEYLSRIIISRPEIVEPMLRFNPAVASRSRRGLVSELSEMIAMHDNIASRIDAIRRFKNLEEIRLGLRDLMGDAPFQETTRGLTRLAEACAEAALSLAWEETSARYGAPSGGEFCVVGLGKLGGRELSYGSDLDIIFIYEKSGETTGGSLGTIVDHEFYSRVANRLMSHLTTMTREGIAYKIDARLRPGGSKGPLATSMETLTRYFLEPGGADVWERQALLKARVVAGKRGLIDRLRSLVRESVALTAELPDLEEKVSQMRKRMEDELGRSSDGYNFKTGPGGMVDVEFLAQYLQLRHGKAKPCIIAPSTLQAIRLAGDHGLLSEQETTLLTEGYLFLRRMEGKIKITGIATSVLPTGNRTKMELLARRLGYAEADGADRVVEDYLAVTGGIRTIFTKFVGEG
ncbi:MAG: bifunctional [glutamate--ammonia ligase]-adenylyl-L-tyrosine phosphorylase/[glutamate--ammonia-ligase] adenylyltransferase, partial [Nitrospirota bacterium]|nr:bifunctional [glutamate--ammonia ligase]-adenylyl-L-tyrosine phosphorylase/[glutamate--ammonia-ligase] adenylyltransferase [Nitrospirota bacterium]